MYIRSRRETTKGRTVDYWAEMTPEEQDAQALYDNTFETYVEAYHALRAVEAKLHALLPEPSGEVFKEFHAAAVSAAGAAAEAVAALVEMLEQD